MAGKPVRDLETQEVTAETSRPAQALFLLTLSR